MRPNRRQTWFSAFLTLAIVASAAVPQTPSAQAGPISEMIARYRQKQTMKLPPMDPPFSKKPIKDPNVSTASFTSKLKKRFSFRKNMTSGTIPFQDSNADRGSR